MIRIGAVADLHGNLPAVPECDVLVIAGDICPAHSHSIGVQEHWLNNEFAYWLEELSMPVVGIAGNHDFIFQNEPRLVPTNLKWTYLEDSEAMIKGLIFWGSPWTPWFGDWAFNAPRDDPEEEFLASLYAGLSTVDVLITHGPPFGYGDRTTSGDSPGSKALLEAIDTVQPALAVYGHIHEGRGSWEHNGSLLANVAAVDVRYELRKDPVVVFDI